MTRLTEAVRKLNGEPFECDYSNEKAAEKSRGKSGTPVVHTSNPDTIIGTHLPADSDTMWKGVWGCDCDSQNCTGKRTG